MDFQKIMRNPKSRSAMEHCASAFQKNHEKRSIADCFFRKQTCNGSLRVIFSERTQEMEHFSLALQFPGFHNPFQPHFRSGTHASLKRSDTSGSSRREVALWRAVSGADSGKDQRDEIPAMAGRSRRSAFVRAAAPRSEHPLSIR